MKTLPRLTAAAALALAACGAEKADPASAIRDALPKREVIQVGAPSASAAATAAVSGATFSAESATSTVADYQGTAPYAVMSYWTAVNINVGVWWTLNLVQLITSFPPTSCGDHACTWGPWLSDDRLVHWKLHVDKASNGYDWVLSQRSAADPQASFVTFLSGHAVPGRDRWHGSGNFTIDFDAQDALPHPSGWVKRDFGTMAITYDSNHGLHLAVTAVGARSNDPDSLGHVTNGAYLYDERGGAGELQLAFKDVTDDETIALRTRWSLAGAGRGDAHANVPDGAGGRNDYYASECWAGESQGFEMTYATWPMALGSETSCVYDRVDPTLAAP